MKRTTLIAIAAAVLCGMTGCAPQPQAAAPEEDIIVAITDPPTTVPTTQPPTEPPTEATEETEDPLEPMNQADAREAYLAIVDGAWYNQFWGNSDPSDADPTGWYLSYDAGIAEIDGNGTYTVSVNADTKGFRLASTDNIEGENIPQGLSFLSVVFRGGQDFFPDTVITVDSIKVDGREIDLLAKNVTAPGEDKGRNLPCIQAVLYDPNSEELPRGAVCADGVVSEQDDADEYSLNVVDPEDFESWQKVEVTFTVSGLNYDSHRDDDDADEDAEETDDEDASGED